MDRNRHPYEYLQRQAAEQQGISPAGTVLYGVVVIYALHQLFVYFDYPVLSPQELLWNAIVYCIPQRLLLEGARRQELKANGMLSQTHAAKSEALRRMLGMGGNAVMQSMPAGGIMRRASTNLFSKPKITSDAPPGLGNWDNSCYQNSVLQGLASLDSLKPFLEKTTGLEDMEGSTSSSLLETMEKLKGADNNGKQLWTPAKLKSMSSWQQQDAQEYFSKIMDELDKEAAKATKARAAKPGLEAVTEKSSPDEDTERVQAQRNPMEGLLAQKVACTRCGFSEGLSLIPFNCLTVPLGSDFAYDLDECLDEYTKLEEITDVECAKCTLLSAEKKLTAMLPQAPSTNDRAREECEGEEKMDSRVLALPPELRAQAFKRLAAIQTALEEDDFEDKTIAEKCEIGKKARVSSTKTRQAVVARAPKSLVVHVNRSVFDEMTGVQRKNYASVRWPGELDLGSWMLRAGDDGESGGVSLLRAEAVGASKAQYRIKAVVTHYGRHENGHYICYRRHPVLLRDEAIVEDDKGSDQDFPSNEGTLKQPEERWWRLSDEEVSSVSEDEVSAQGGVFMLFYERIDEREPPATPAITDIAASEAVTEPLMSKVEERQDDLAVVNSAASDAGLPDASSIPTESSSSVMVSPPSEQPGETASTPAASTADLTDTASEAQLNGDSSGQVPAQPISGPPKPPTMRTARGRQSSKSEKAFGGMGMRAVAAT